MTRTLFALVALLAGPVFGQSTQPVRVFLGDLHAHTGYSDGTGNPEQAYVYARDIARLDFLAVTEHNHLLGGDKSTPQQKADLYDGPATWSLVSIADRLNQPGTFVTIYGQEFSSISKGNHVNVFDVKPVIDVPNGEFGRLLKWMGAHRDSSGERPIIQLNHPGLAPRPKKNQPDNNYGRDDFASEADWIKAMSAVTPLLEMVNGEPMPGAIARAARFVAEDQYRQFLRLGFRLAPTACQDNHKPDWGKSSDIRTGIIAAELTRPALLQAMRDRHVYATEDKNLRLVPRVDGRLCGDELPAASEKPEVAIDIQDEDEPAADYTIDVFAPTQDGALAERVLTITHTGNGVARFAAPALPAGRYMYFRLTQQSGERKDLTWTAPVWTPAK